MDQILQDFSEKAHKILRPLKWIATASGCNIMYRTTFLHPLKLWNLFLLLTAILGCMAQLHFIWNHRQQPFDVYIEAILIFFEILISLSKLWFFTFSQQRLFAMIQTVQNSEILSDLEIFEMDLVEQSTIIKSICKILNASWTDIKLQLIVLITSVFCISGWYSVNSLLLNIYYIFSDHQQDLELQFPFPASFPLWHDKDKQFPYFLVEYTIISMEVYLATVSSIAFTGLFSVISIHCLTLLKILRKLITFSTTCHVLPKDRIKYLQACIKLHQKIHEFCQQLNLLYRMQILPLFLVYCLVICLLTFQVSVDLGNDIYAVIKVFLYILTAFFELGIFCFNGQRITSVSDILPLAIYDCAWYEQNEHFKFMTQIMLLRSNHNIAMDVGGFATMSLVTLLTIFRSSASYFLFLQKCM